MGNNQHKYNFLAAWVPSGTSSFLWWVAQGSNLPAHTIAQKADHPPILVFPVPASISFIIAFFPSALVSCDALVCRSWRLAGSPTPRKLPQRKMQPLPAPAFDPFNCMGFFDPIDLMPKPMPRPPPAPVPKLEPPPDQPPPRPEAVGYVPSAHIARAIRDGQES
jgi:hypothetical protein